MNVQKIPYKQLMTDLEDSKADIINCQTALKMGILEVQGFRVQKRLDDNKNFIEIINKEIQRRIETGEVSLEPGTSGFKLVQNFADSNHDTGN